MGDAFNPYKVLGVKEDATADQIKDAYREKARTLHPDHGGGADAFAEITAARDILLDPKARADFDRFGLVAGDPEHDDRAMVMKSLNVLFCQAVLTLEPEQLAKTDVIGLVREKIEEIRSASMEEDERLDKMKKRHKKLCAVIEKRLRTKKKGAQNFLLVALNAALETVDAQKLQQEMNIKFADKMFKLLSEFSYDIERQKAQGIRVHYVMSSGR